MEKNVVADSSAAHLENQKPITTCSLTTVQVSSTSSSIKIKNEKSQDTFSINQSNDKLNIQCKLLLAEDANDVISGNIFNKAFVVVLDSCDNDTHLDMVNSTTQHPKTRNSTCSTIDVNSDNSIASDNSVDRTQDPILAKEQIADEASMIMNSKLPLNTITPVIEVSASKQWKQCLFISF